MDPQLTCLVCNQPAVEGAQHCPDHTPILGCPACGQLQLDRTAPWCRFHRCGSGKALDEETGLLIEQCKNQLRPGSIVCEAHLCTKCKVTCTVGPGWEECEACKLD